MEISTNTLRSLDKSIENFKAGIVSAPIEMEPVKLPTEQEFQARLDETKEWATSVGYQEEVVADIVKAVRKRKHS